ncbi:DUF998 domain-containing protein [Saccharomonospora saliphila]|uniref:DUF998 domain-containing protein n=1 Tax=Saccharomonospora saliphila TaxID=369829 RepID=UPI0003667E2D|nr:DUF998 domain-containing protein [Saccharomonospora saliphila]
MGQLGTRTATAGAATRLRAWTVAAWAALGWAVFTLLVLHAVSSFDPVRDPVSRYAFTAEGAGMLEASLISFAIGVVAVHRVLVGSGVRVSGTATALVAVTTAGLVAAALFPATYTDDIDPVSGLIHQYASLLAFLSLPGIALCVLEHCQDSASAGVRARLTRLLVADLAALALFGASYCLDNFLPPTLVYSSLAEVLPVGGVQRVVLVLHVFLLATLLTVARRPRGEPSADVPE